jgi:hypothetical protein
MMLYELMYTKTLLANKYLVWQPLFIIAGIYLLYIDTVMGCQADGKEVECQ